MNRNNFLKLAAIILLALAALPATLPVHAVATSIGLFYGGCGNFSVDLAVTGTEDDGGGLDKTRFKLTDGAGKVLYQEDNGVQVGRTVGSQVYNMSYTKNVFPIKNPVRFAVVQLDPSSNEKWEVGFVTFNAPCLEPSGNPTRTGYQTPNALVKGTVLATTHLFEQPGINPLTLTVNPGNIFPVIYRNRDNSWVDIYVGGNELVWIPTSTIAVDINALAFPPSRVFGAGLGGGDNYAGTPALGGGGVSAGGVTTRGTLYIRSQPSTSSSQIGFVPRNTGIAVVGRDASARWLKITYKDVTGWVTAFYVNMKAADIRNLPVVQ